MPALARNCPAIIAVAIAVPTLAQTIDSLEGLVGTKVEAEITRDQTVKREGRQRQVKVHTSWTVEIEDRDRVKSTYVPTAETPSGKGRGETISGGLRLNEQQPVNTLGGGTAMWSFE